MHFLHPVILRRTHSLHISEWYPIEAQVTSSAVTIPHPLQDKPARVEVQVKVQENGRDLIFPASGSAQRDDDSDNDYGVSFTFTTRITSRSLSLILTGRQIKES